MYGLIRWDESILIYLDLKHLRRDFGQARL